MSICCLFHRVFQKLPAEPLSSVGSVAYLRNRGRWFDPRFGQFSFQVLMIVIATGFVPLSSLSIYFENGFVGKQPGAWKEYCMGYWLKELQESMDRCTGRLDTTEILLKMERRYIQYNKKLRYVHVIWYASFFLVRRIHQLLSKIIFSWKLINPSTYNQFTETN